MKITCLAPVLQCVQVVTAPIRANSHSLPHIDYAVGLPGRSTAGDACQSAVPCSVTRNSVQPPVGVPAHGYWSLSGPGIRTRSSSPSAFTLAGGKSCSAKDKRQVHSVGRGVDKLPDLLGFPCRDDGPVGAGGLTADNPPARHRRLALMDQT